MLGENLVWYKWMFYNENEEDGNWSDMVIFGNNNPFMYTTFWAWHDFFDQEFVVICFSIILGCSWFTLIGLPVQLIINLVLQITIMIESFECFEDA